MKPDEYFLPFAQAAFEAYAVKANYKTWDNKPMPGWDAVGADIQGR